MDIGLKKHMALRARQFFQGVLKNSMKFESILPYGRIMEYFWYDLISSFLEELSMNFLIYGQWWGYNLNRLNFGWGKIKRYFVTAFL